MRFPLSGTGNALTGLSVSLAVRRALSSARKVCGVDQNCGGRLRCEKTDGGNKNQSQKVNFHDVISLIMASETASRPAPKAASASPATGNVEVDIDTVLNTMHIIANFSGLTGTTTASHIHCCTPTPGTGTAGVGTTTPNFAGFPLGVTSGTYINTLDLTLASSYNPAFVTANGGATATAETSFWAGLAAGDAYFNIHTSNFPSGEIRGFLLASAVPEPSTRSMMILGFAGLGFMAYRRRSLKVALAA